MGKRNRRIPASELQQMLPECLGHQIHVLMKDGITFSGRLQSSAADHLVLRDPLAFWYNFKKKQHTIPFSGIDEVYTDYVSPW